VTSTFTAQLDEAGQAFSAVLRNANLRRVQLSWAGTVCAYWIFIVALGLYAYERGGAAAVGLVALLRVLPSVVAAPFGAVLGDRFPRERIVVAINVGRTVTILAAAAAAYLSAPAGVVYALASLMGLLQSIFRPTQSALLPLLARTPEELTAANSVLTTIESIGIFIGPAIGGLLLARASTDTVFAITGVVFLAAALVLVGVSPQRSGEAQIRRKSFVSEAFAGFGTVAHDTRLRLIISLYGLQTLTAGALNVLIVILALETLDLGKSGIGFLNSAVGVGGLLGGILAIGLAVRPQLASAFGVGLALAGAPIAAVALWPHTAAALVLLAVAGLGTTIVDVAGVTLLQRNTPDEVLTRVMGVVQSVFVGTLGLGAIIAPALIDGVGDRWTLVLVGLPIGVAALLAWPQLRRLDRAAQAPPTVELLRRIPIFAPLPPAVLEQLARDARAIHVDPGQRIVTQGEAGDDFYVIASGDVDVEPDTGAPRVLHEGDHFGEIALLRDVPRTATVSARSTVDLVAIDRDTFLAGVTGNPESEAAAHAIAAARLSSLRQDIASV
jgi:MFS family permease